MRVNRTRLLGSEEATASIDNIARGNLANRILFEGRGYVRKLCFVISIALLLVLIGSCSKDCPTCPKPPENERYKGRLYVTMAFVSTGVFIIDTETDSVIDSLIYPTSAFDVDVSENGQYLSVGGWPATTRVYDAKSMTILWSMQGLAGAKFADHGAFIYGRRVGTDFLEKYRVPSFEFVGAESLAEQGSEIKYLPFSNELFMVRDSNEFYAVDFESLRLRNTWYILAPDGKPLHLMYFDVHPERRFLYATGLYSGGSVFVTYSLDSGKVIATQSLVSSNGEVAVSPTGGDVYVTDPGEPMYGFRPGTLYVMSAETGQYIEGISLFGYLPQNPYIGLYAFGVQVTPDGSQVYVLTGEAKTQGGTVIRIDAKAREVEDFVFPKLDRYPFELAIGPRP